MVRKGVKRLFTEHVFVLMEGLRDQITERLLFGVLCVHLRQSGGEGAGGADLYWFRCHTNCCLCPDAPEVNMYNEGPSGRPL